MVASATSGRRAGVPGVITELAHGQPPQHLRADPRRRFLRRVGGAVEVGAKAGWSRYGVDHRSPPRGSGHEDTSKGTVAAAL
jgi:hypothetical protein